jgi:hypothetical protein
MSGDIAYEPELQRTISVDIRYVMWTIDKLMGGKNIVDEVKYAPKKEVKPVAPATQTPAPTIVPAPDRAPAQKPEKVGAGKPVEKGTTKNNGGATGSPTKVPAATPKKK